MKELSSYEKVLLYLEVFATLVCLFIIYVCVVTMLNGAWFSALWIAMAIITLCIIGKDIHDMSNQMQD